MRSRGLVWVALGCAIVAACSPAPRGARPLTHAESAAVGVAVDAWRERRSLEVCTPLEHLAIAVADDEAFRDACVRCAVGAPSCPAPNDRYGRATGCTHTRNPSPFETYAATTIVVSNRVDERERFMLAVHETLHVVRGCYVDRARGSSAYLHRYRRGVHEDDFGRMRNALDPNHNDAELWVRAGGASTIEGVAQARVSP